MFATLKTSFLRLRRPAPAPPSPRPRLWGVSDPELEHLLALRQSPAWATWEKVLDRVWQAEAERLVEGLPHDEYLKVAGAVHALRRIAGLVDAILTHDAERTVAHDHADLERARAGRERDSRYAVRYSPYDAPDMAGR